MVGTVQVRLAQPENQPHRADLAKMLVHRRARRRGVARRCSQRRSAPRSGRQDVAGARYRERRCGAPVYPVRLAALRADSALRLWPDGAPCATTIFFKLLRS